MNLQDKLRKKINDFNKKLKEQKDYEQDDVLGLTTNKIALYEEAIALLKKIKDIMDKPNTTQTEIKDVLVDLKRLSKGELLNISSKDNIVHELEQQLHAQAAAAAKSNTSKTLLFSKGETHNGDKSNMPEMTIVPGVQSTPDEVTLRAMGLKLVGNAVQFDGNNLGSIKEGWAQIEKKLQLIKPENQSKGLKVEQFQDTKIDPNSFWQRCKSWQQKVVSHPLYLKCVAILENVLQNLKEKVSPKKKP